MFKKNKKISIALILSIFGLTLLFQIFLYIYMYNKNIEYKNQLEDNYLEIYYLNDFKLKIISNNELKKFLLNEEKVFDYYYLNKNINEIIEDIEDLQKVIELKELNYLKKDFININKLINKLLIAEIDINNEYVKKENINLINNVLSNLNELNNKYNEINKREYIKLLNSNFKNIKYMYFTIFLNIILFLLVFINFKNIKNEEIELVNRLKRYQLILNSAPNGIVIIDKEGNIVEINKKALQLVSWTSEDLIGQNYKKLLINNHINNLLENKEVVYNKFFKKSYLKDSNNKEIEIETFVSKNEIDKEDSIIMVVIK